MAAVVRPYRADDAEELVGLLNRNGYGPAALGRPLDAAGLRAVLRERCVTDLLVGEDRRRGEDGGRIVGCLAFGLGSGRRSCEPGARFAGLYLVDRRHRNSLLPGRLFRDGFTRMLQETGVRTLRLEASPSNSRALGLYLRAGFRAAPTARPDEEGYLELVSHLPGVIRDLLDANRELTGPRSTAAVSWEMLKPGRAATVSTGVVLRDGRWVVTYPVVAGHLEFSVDVDLDSGTLLSCRQLAGEALNLPPGRPVPAGAAASLLIDRTLPSGARLSVDDAGTVRLAGRGGHELLRERWPSALGAEPPGVRRQGAHRAVRATPSDDGSAWTLTAPGDPITRTVRVDAEEISITSTPEPGVTVVASPWIRTRIGHRGVKIDDQWRAGPIIHGLWPEEWTDFEAAYQGPEPAALWWSDGTLAVTSTWSGAHPRPEGLGAPHLTGEAPGTPVTCTLRISRSVDLPGSGPPGTATRVRPVRQPVRRAVLGSPGGDELSLTARPQQGHVVLDGADHRLTVAPTVGMVRWEYRGTTVLAGAHPNRAPLGALISHRAGLWCARGAKRDADDQGMEWIDDDDLGVLQWSQETGAGWSLAIHDESTLSVTAHPGPEPGAGLQRDRTAVADTSIMLTPSIRRGSPIVISVGGRLWRIDNARCSWRGSVNAVAIELESGLGLAVRGPRGHDPEIFIRRLGDALVLAAVGSAGAPLTADLTVTTSLSRAEKALTGGLGDG